MTTESSKNVLIYCCP